MASGASCAVPVSSPPGATWPRCRGRLLGRLPPADHGHRSPVSHLRMRGMEWKTNCSLEGHMFGNSWRIARIAGVEIRIDASWAIVVLLIGFLFFGNFDVMFTGTATGVLILLTVVSTILFFASVLLHELAHSLTARARGSRSGRSRCSSSAVSATSTSMPSTRVTSSGSPSLARSPASPSLCSSG